MSDVMLHGVLNMPPNLWCDSPIDIAQRHSRYKEASQRIEQLERELAEVTKQRDELAEAIRTHKQTLPFTLVDCDIELYNALKEVSYE